MSQGLNDQDRDERKKPPVLRPLYDLAWAKLLLWAATAGARGELRPGVHVYLAELYFGLADAFQARGRVTTAKQMRDRGRMHALAGPPPEPPPLAVAVGIPQPLIVTDARGLPMPSPVWQKTEEELFLADARQCATPADFRAGGTGRTL